ncbi:MAG: hypothetical protein EAZ89_14295, partial [Bacteroidetes bacterium]
NTLPLLRSNWAVTPVIAPLTDPLGCGPQVMNIALLDSCVDCSVTLSMDTQLPIDFTDITTILSGQILSQNSFVLYALYTYQGLTDTIEIQGQSDCILPCKVVQPLLCANPVFPVVNIEPVDDCRQNLLDMAEWQATQAYFQYLDSVSTRFDSLYLARCLQQVEEKIELTIPFNQYHHTLYYYDQAGNLVQTVPPSGVKFLDPQLQDDVNAARLSGSAAVVVPPPPHEKKTQYRYNSLNQLIWQLTPDAGEKRYWYDNLGRIVASQDARQISGGWYAYIRYDALGRSYEAGEIHKPGAPISEQIARDPAQLAAWLNAGTKRQQILTHYDFPINTSINGLFPGGQQELRGRVATVRYVDGEDPNRDHASHYSYDIHGNVSRLIQDFPSLAHLGYQYVPVTYDYDLLSGKVNAVHLAPEDPRLGFSHFYTYDADNRIIEVKTRKGGQLSASGTVSDRDARYFYYDHGPLARTELGADNIQGLDFAYTIQGWIKGVNSDTRRPDSDMGKDFSSGYLAADPDAHLSFLPDAFGYTLKYFAPNAGSAGDYKAIGSQPPFEAANWQSAAQYRSLYNGNIGAMATAIRDTTLAGFPIHLNVYHYDQLNRLTSRQVNRDPNVSANNAWAPVATNDYATAYRYDPDGDILGLLRNGQSASGPLEMDSLTYFYEDGTHRLTHVFDNIDAANYAEDIDSQSWNNYTYDSIGNLISDVSEGISNITWNLDGKIRGVQRTPGSARPDLSFWYDAGGNRAVKLVQPTATEDSWSYTYYLRDPQGNTLATLPRRYTPADEFSNPVNEGA